MNAPYSQKSPRHWSPSEREFELAEEALDEWKRTGPPAVGVLTVQRNSASLTEAVATQPGASVASSATPFEAFSRYRPQPDIR